MRKLMSGIKPSTRGASAVRRKYDDRPVVGPKAEGVYSLELPDRRDDHTPRLKQPHHVGNWSRWDLPGRAKVRGCRLNLLWTRQRT